MPLPLITSIAAVAMATQTFGACTCTLCKYTIVTCTSIRSVTPQFTLHLMLKTLLIVVSIFPALGLPHVLMSMAAVAMLWPLCLLGHVHCVNTLCMYMHIYIVGHMYIEYACYIDI